MGSEICLTLASLQLDKRKKGCAADPLINTSRLSSNFHDLNYTHIIYYPNPITSQRVLVLKMMITQRVCLLLLALFLLGTTYSVSATTFTLENSCSYTVWPGTLSGNGAAVLGDGGFVLSPGASIQFSGPPGWSGRFWARTDCNFDESGNGNCTTGDCGGVLKCTGGGVSPVTLVEFTLATTNNVNDKDFYDVSLVDGYNVGMGVRPAGGAGTGDCQYAGCVADLNGNCPEELRVIKEGSVVACRSACAAFNSPEFCCTGDHATPQTCSPTQYSVMFKNACPTAYSYAYDDASSTCTCAGSDYLITFCPTHS